MYTEAGHDNSYYEWDEIFECSFDEKITEMKNSLGYKFVRLGI